jgi:hypothetical protein
MQDEEELSYADKPLGNPNNPTHALCTGCNEVKPIKSFKTKSSNAQAISWGYKRAIEMTSSRCNECRPPKKKIGELTIKEIQNRIASGDLKGGVFGQMVKEDRRAEGIRKKREGVIKRWKDMREQAWHDLLRSSDTEHDRVRKQKSLNQPNQNGTPCPKLLAFFTAYQQVINDTRTFLTLEKKRGLRTPDKGKPWTYYVSKKSKDKLKELWTACPHEKRLHLTHPAVLTNQGDEA